MIVIKVIKNHLTPLKKSDYTKIHNLRDPLHRPLTATSEQFVFSWQDYYGFTGYAGGDFFLVYSSSLQRFLYPFGNVGHGLDFSMNEVVGQQMDFLKQMLTWLIILTLIIVILVICYFRYTLTKPLQKLAGSAQTFVARREEKGSKEPVQTAISEISPSSPMIRSVTFMILFVRWKQTSINIFRILPLLLRKKNALVRN